VAADRTVGSRQVEDGLSRGWVIVEAAGPRLGQPLFEARQCQIAWNERKPVRDRENTRFLQVTEALEQWLNRPVNGRWWCLVPKRFDFFIREKRRRQVVLPTPPLLLKRAMDFTRASVERRESAPSLARCGVAKSRSSASIRECAERRDQNDSRIRGPSLPRRAPGSGKP
jgi:hypothetical protein